MQGQRPALRKVLSTDVNASVSMVLCVSAVRTPQRIELTDGWYAIEAQLDSRLQAQLQRGRIYVGQKLRVCGASLLGDCAKDGMEALEIKANNSEASATAALQLNGNGTRPARWHAKLGFQRAPFFRVSVASLVAGGGGVPCIEVVVERAWPARYMEKLGDTRVLRAEAQEMRLRALHAKRSADVSDASRLRACGHHSPVPAAAPLGPAPPPPLTRPRTLTRWSELTRVPSLAGATTCRRVAARAGRRGGPDAHAGQRQQPGRQPPEAVRALRRQRQPHIVAVSGP